MVVILLSAIVFGILLRALKRDISRYNEIEVEDQQEEFGWKMIHGDVFRSPSNRMILSVLVGNGAQILLMASLTIGRLVVVPVLSCTLSDNMYMPSI